jgi:hypothetical protein
MLETGDFIQIRFQHEARNKKPIGIHWLQAFQRSLEPRGLHPLAIDRVSGSTARRVEVV